MVADHPFISIIIVNYNGLNYLDSCLSALNTQTYLRKNYEIIVVDNGSTDRSIDFLAEHYPAVVVLRNQVNEGFAKPNNQAAKIAKGEFLVLLNNDMVVSAEWLEALISTQQRTSAECVGGTILNHDGSAIDFIGGSIDRFGYGYQYSHGESAQSIDRQRAEQEIFYACGGAMLINKRVYLAIGGLDEDFYLYYEDTDLGWRLWLLGYRVVLSPQAVSFHKHNGTAKKFSWSQIAFFGERNSLLMLYKNYEDKNLYEYLFKAIILRLVKLIEKLRIDNSCYDEPPLKVMTFLEKLMARISTGKILIRLMRKLDTLAIYLWAMASVLRKIPDIKEKRKYIQLNRKRRDDEIMGKFYSPESYFIKQQYKIFDQYFKGGIKNIDNEN
jgi:GT2 family glycosyltransferase